MPLPSHTQLALAKAAVTGATGIVDRDESQVL
jgi:hypothetical protein